MKRLLVVLSILATLAVSSLPHAGAATPRPSPATPSPAARALPGPSAAAAELPSWLQAADGPSALPPAGMTPAPIPACIFTCPPQCVLVSCKCVCYSGN
jgi:hypothetical protein